MIFTVIFTVTAMHLRLLLMLPLLLVAQLASAAEVAVTHAWSRATSPSMPNGAVFLTIANSGSADDQLVSVASAAAERIELHTVIAEGDTKRMVPVDVIPVLAKSATILKPGSFHIMLFGMKQPLTEGQSIALTLTFEHAGTVSVTSMIAGAAAMSAPDASASGPAAQTSCCTAK